MSKQTNILDSIKTIVKEEIRPVEERLDKKITNFKDELLAGNDKLDVKLDKILAEQAGTSASLNQHGDKIENHEIRIQKIEANTGLA